MRLIEIILMKIRNLGFLFINKIKKLSIKYGRVKNVGSSKKVNYKQNYEKN